MMHSIKVRLERFFLAAIALLLGFQFHKGAIRTSICRMPYPRIRHFNSIKVRLEQVYQGSGWMLLHPFQFHKGAIRTQMHLSHSTLLFHFNSIKVRLEPSKRFLNISIELFQFHKGAIRTSITFPST